MLKAIFLPDKIGSYYLFSSRIVGLEINKTHISGCVTKKSGHLTTLEQLSTEPIEQGLATAYVERTAQALKKVMQFSQPSDIVYSVLPSSIVVFKEIQLPFTSYEKIGLVLNFEIEPLLPFALSQAVIDFIITHQTATHTTILVVAVQKKYIDEHISIFKEAGLPAPTVITIDFLVMYNLYLQSAFYRSLGQYIVLTEFGTNAMRMGHIDYQQLKQVRNLPHAGLASITKAVAEELNIAPTQAMEQLLRFGLTSTEHPNYLNAITKAFSSIGKSMQLTIDSFSTTTSELPEEQKKNILLLMGQGARIPGIDTLISNETGCQTILIDPAKLLESIDLGSYKNSPLLPTSLTSIGATLSSGIIDQLNLCKDEFKETNERLFIAQLLSFGILLFTFIILLVGHATLQIHALNREVNQSTKEAIVLLHDNFKDEVDANESDLKEAVDAARDAIGIREKKWSKFSNEQRLSPLKYLLELTNTLNKDVLGLKTESILITDNTLTLQGQVNDHEALKTLEQEINQVPLFKVIQPGPADPIFQMKIHLKSGAMEIKK